VNPKGGSRKRSKEMPEKMLERSGLNKRSKLLIFIMFIYINTSGAQTPGEFWRHARVVL
jgi:hypothetical protein